MKSRLRFCRFWLIEMEAASVVGVDEVGRGCLAGPVVAAAIAFPKNHTPIMGIDDSKRLSAKKRESLDLLIRKSTSWIGIGQVEAAEIDAIGIVAAVGKAMKQACLAIPHIDTVLVDGPSPLGLDNYWPTTPIVHGDQLVYAISAASIIAKVYRDRLMQKLAITIPQYGWGRNVGYGTKEHLQALATYGLTPYHRKTFTCRAWPRR